jgi:hypothetical protein
MGKVTLAVLVAAIALAVYWFWWSDQGANSPITLEGTISATGVPMMPGMQGPLEGSFTLQATPSKRKFTIAFQDIRITDIFCPSKKLWYVLNEKKKVYAKLEFNLVDTSKTDLYEVDETWFSGLKRTAEWDYIGAGEEKRFCNKQTFSGLPKWLTDAIKASGAESAGLSQIEALAKGVQWEMWFTPETRVGKRYFGLLNKMARVEPVGRGEQNATLDLSKLFKGKRPQVKYANLDFFPIPLKLNVSMGPVKVDLSVKNLSRKSVPKDAFEVPSGYTKVDIKQVMQ